MKCSYIALVLLGWAYTSSDVAAERAPAQTDEQSNGREQVRPVAGLSGDGKKDVDECRSAGINCCQADKCLPLANTAFDISQKETDEKFGGDDAMPQDPTAGRVLGGGMLARGGVDDCVLCLFWVCDV